MAIVRLVGPKPQLLVFLLDKHRYILYHCGDAAIFEAGPVGDSSGKYLLGVLDFHTRYALQYRNDLSASKI